MVPGRSATLRNTVYGCGFSGTIAEAVGRGNSEWYNQSIHRRLHLLSNLTTTHHSRNHALSPRNPIHHPIQYIRPGISASAQPDLDLTSILCTSPIAHGQGQAGFGVAFEWDIPVLEGYPRVSSQRRAVSERFDFWGCDTPEIGRGSLPAVLTLS